MNRRRLFAVAVSGALAVVALAACRSSPAVASYVGDSEITEKSVDAMLTDAKAKAEADPAAQLLVPRRDEIVSTLTVNQLCQRMKADQGLTFRPVETARVAEAERLPADATFTQARADFYTCLFSMDQAGDAEPTEADLRGIYERGKAAGLFPAEATFEQVAPQLDGEELRAALGQRQRFAEAADRYDVTVNPRYQPLELPLLSFQGGVVAIALPLGEVDTDPFIVRAR